MAGRVFYVIQNERKRAKDMNKNDRRKKLVRGEEKIEEEWRRKERNIDEWKKRELEGGKLPL